MRFAKPLAVVAAMLSCAVLSAATITVTSASDSGVGSLREAVASAGEGDTIRFDPTLSGSTILLTSEIAIDSVLTIIGPGADQLTLDGSGNSRIFQISTDVRIRGLTFANGFSTSLGGAIFSFFGTLVVDGCYFVDNTSSGSQGGAIMTNVGALEVYNSSFIGNTAWIGGAIRSGSSTVYIERSTFHDNTGSSGGGAIYRNGSGRLTIVSSTITENEGGFQGGGIMNFDDTVEIYRTILSGNFGSFIHQSDYWENAFGAGIKLYEHSIYGDPLFFHPNDGTILQTSEPMLEPPADNGGTMPTMKPACLSPAFDGVIGATMSVDQIGNPQFGNHPDVGAYEAQVLLNPAAQTLSAVASQELCGGANGSIDLTVTSADPPLTYLWTTGETTEDIAGLVADTYAVIVTSDTACNGTIPTDTLVVEVVGDTTRPVVPALTTYTIPTDPGQCGAIANYPLPPGSDECDASPVFAIEAGLGAGAFFPLGSSVEDWTLTDSSGNATPFQIEIVVVDQEPPAFPACPGDVVVTAAPGDSGAIVSYGPVAAVDACSGSELPVLLLGPPSGAFFPLGATTVLWAAVDDDDNIGACAFTVTVDEPTCNSAIAPTGPDAVVTTGATLSWTPVPLTVACQVAGRPLGAGGFATLPPVFGDAPTLATVPPSVLTPGTSYEWQVRCACSVSPLDVTGFSALDTFSVPLLRAPALLHVHPNPAPDRLLLRSNRTGPLHIRDLAGRTWFRDPGGTTREVDVRHWPAGVYSIEQDGLVRRVVVAR